MGFVLAVDGGNSKTDVVLFAPDGSSIARHRGPGSGGGPLHAARVIGALVTLAGVDHAAITTCVAALAGLDFADDAPAFEGALALQFPTARIRALNDAAVMLSVHDVREHALVLVSGAGFNAVARGPLGVATVPALDWISGDWGGGDAVGREVVRVAYRASDGRGPDTTLRAAVLALTGAADFTSLARDLRDGVFEPGIFAPLATREAAAGDRVAAALVDRAVDEAVALAGEVTSRAWGDSPVGEGTPAMLVGGMFADESLLDAVSTRLVDAGFDPARLPHDAVVGVVREACATAGLSDLVAARVIDGLATSGSNESRTE